MKKLALAMVAAGALAVVPQTAFAGFHLMKVVEVFPGTPAAPNAQYVMLRMYFGGQTFVGGHTVSVFDGTNTMRAQGTFATTLTNGASQANILISTTQAQTFFAVTPDLTITAGMIPSGGKVCFDGIDCVSWGSFSGPTTETGTPFNASTGITAGTAIRRRLDISGSATVLDDLDDTNNSANDFREVVPAPINNAGMTGTPRANNCGNMALDGLEQCDDGNSNNNDSCSNQCIANAVTSDAGVTDAGMADTGTPDTGTPDTGTPDAGSVDVPTVTDSGEVDVPTVSDVAVATDTGSDTSTATDSGVRDTGADAGVTGGKTGCACQTPASSGTHGKTGIAVMAALALAHIASRRRRAD